MAKTIDRNKQLERAATLRAILTAHFNKIDEFVPVTKVYADLKPKLDELKVTEKILASQLKNLASNSLLIAKRDGIRNLYANENLVTYKEVKTKVDIKVKPLKAGVIPAYKIDVVKGQKRVRITIDDVMFDIGVVNG